MESTRTPETAGQVALQPHGASFRGACLNCGAPLGGAFCSACGQRDIPAHPSARELVSDAVHELWGWDGRVAVSVRALLSRPGFLTREFLEGRRAQYVSPVRLYLIASVAYFVLAAAAPDVRLASGETVQIGLRVGVTVDGRNAALTPAQREAALAEVGEAPALVQPLLRRAVDDPIGFKRRIFQTMPRIFFVLVPAFAGIVALFYRGRKFPAHLYFAVHLHAFIFSALALVELAKFTGVAAVLFSAAAIALLAIPVYATVAFRRVYEQALVKTIAKELAIAGLYLLVWSFGFFTAMYWASRPA